MAYGVALGALAAVVPFLFSKLNTRGGSGGLFRTFTTREGAALPPSSEEPPMFTEEQIFGPSPTAQQADPYRAPEQLPQIAVKPTPSAPTVQEGAKLPSGPTTPTPLAMPTPPPMTAEQDRAQEIEALRRLVDNPTAENLAILRDPSRRAAIEELLTVAPADLAARVRALWQSALPWDGPGQAQLPTIQDIESLPQPPLPPPPPPFPESTSVTSSVTSQPEQLPPQERGELPAELQQLPASMPSTQAIEAPPEGYDPVKARNLAKQVAANITNRGTSYSRDLVKQFQRFAGIDVEGIYGGETRGALEFFGVRRPPRALFKPTETVPYKWANWS